MEKININKIEEKITESIKFFDLDQESIEALRKDIQPAPDEETQKELNMKLFDLISKADEEAEKEIIDEVRELILKGADVNYKTETRGDYPLLACTRKGFGGIFLLLIRAGADINLTNNFLTTATMAAARHNRKEMLKLLIDLGADINAKCLDGDTAFISATRHGNHECMRILMEAGCHLNAKNHINQSAIEVGPCGNEVNMIENALEPNNSDLIKYETKDDITMEDADKLIEEATNELKLILK